MTENEVKAQAFAMPLTSPAFPCGPYRFVDREYLIITYRTDPDALRAMIPPVAQLPVLEVISGVHILCDLTLGLGTVVHDYLADRTQA